MKQTTEKEALIDGIQNDRDVDRKFAFIATLYYDCRRGRDLEEILDPQ